MSKTLYRVAVRYMVEDKYPQKNYVIVVATDPHSALDKATEHNSADSLYDEEIQRAIVNNEIKESRIERKYDDYIRELDYVGEL